MELKDYIIKGYYRTKKISSKAFAILILTAYKQRVSSQSVIMEQKISFAYE